VEITPGAAAGFTVAMCAFATAYAQAKIGAAAAGATAEKPEVAGKVLVLEALPETIIILGFVVAAMIIVMT